MQKDTNPQLGGVFIVLAGGFFVLGVLGVFQNAAEKVAPFVPNSISLLNIATVLLLVFPVGLDIPTFRRHRLFWYMTLLASIALLEVSRTRYFWLTVITQPPMFLSFFGVVPILNRRIRQRWQKSGDKSDSPSHFV